MSRVPSPAPAAARGSGRACGKGKSGRNCIGLGHLRNKPMVQSSPLTLDLRRGLRREVPQLARIGRVVIQLVLEPPTFRAMPSHRPARIPRSIRAKPLADAHMKAIAHSATAVVAFMNEDVAAEAGLTTAVLAIGAVRDHRGQPPGGVALSRPIVATRMAGIGALQPMAAECDGRVDSRPWLPRELENTTLWPFGYFWCARGSRHQSASGLGRSWKWKAIGTVPLPPSFSHGTRSPLVVHTPRPFHPALGSSMRPSMPLA